jgi:hypothetical protein
MECRPVTTWLTKYDIATQRPLVWRDSGRPRASPPRARRNCRALPAPGGWGESENNPPRLLSSGTATRGVNAVPYFQSRDFGINRCRSRDPGTGPGIKNIQKY